MKKETIDMCLMHANIYEKHLTNRSIAGIIYSVRVVSESECALCKMYPPGMKNLIGGYDRDENR